MIKFYGYYRSSAAYRCRIAFNLKNIDYDLQLVHLRKDGGQQKSPDYKKINPQALIPSIEDNDFTLTQSMAIIEWLDEKYPEPNLLPKDVNLRAKVRAFSQSIACEIHPLQNLRVQEYISQEFKQDSSQIDQWLKKWLGDGLSACQEIIRNENIASQFCFGNAPSLADICLIPQIFSAQRFGINLNELPVLMKIFDNCNNLSAFSKAHPSKQPDAEN